MAADHSAKGGSPAPGKNATAGAKKGAVAAGKAGKSSSRAAKKAASEENLSSGDEEEDRQNDGAHDGSSQAGSGGAGGGGGGEMTNTFQGFFAEADVLAKQGDFRKANELYTKALNLRPGDKNCLVARSKGYLQLGDAQAALQDAEESLSQDKTFFRGIYQKAESLYALGNFELALVAFHQGNRMRPELNDFRLGIQKAKEAIDNAIGNTKKGQVRRVPRTVQANERRLLGELYEDKVYLDRLKEELGFSHNIDADLSQKVEDGLAYLAKRIDFWRQQKPAGVLVSSPSSRHHANESRSSPTSTSADASHSGHQQRQQSPIATH